MTEDVRGTQESLCAFFLLYFHGSHKVPTGKVAMLNMPLREESFLDVASQSLDVSWDQQMKDRGCD